VVLLLFMALYHVFIAILGVFMFLGYLLLLYYNHCYPQACAKRSHAGIVFTQ